MKKILINSLFIFVISSIFHFVYNIFPNNITALFFPVNESIWEHYKLLYTSAILFSYLNMGSKSYHLEALLRAVLIIVILSIFYLPIYYLYGENLVSTLIILFISILITELILSRVINKNYRLLNIISIPIIISISILFMYLTYNPIHNDLFLDKTKNTYGLNK